MGAPSRQGTGSRSLESNDLSKHHTLELHQPAYSPLSSHATSSSVEEFSYRQRFSSSEEVQRRRHWRFGQKEAYNSHLNLCNRLIPLISFHTISSSIEEFS
ncbi:hypothetical protein AVEN_89369-1 [Araneus ventricosus]|uniref:Uncharacterized protein n=1 Tax=Araneus ventricosus TaxID=182803 RepID=A0A4Y2RDN2_ARAVE|nr:hypothetical protein AVEN_253056-1 [Araneus ventricosus]GBN73813.1 hypothetical protein AVEN_89369-1 [Araneus ventricosus]